MKYYKNRFSPECILQIYMPFIFKRNKLTVFNIVRSQNLLRNVFLRRKDATQPLLCENFIIVCQGSLHVFVNH